MTASEEVATPTLITPGPNAVDITPNQDGGVLKEIIKEGEGDGLPVSGCTVRVMYEGKLTDGTIFDASKDPSKPFEFTLGKESVIKGWEIGIASMKKGEVAILTCKPDYAYGKSEQGSIPANSTLIFEITMMGWAVADLSKEKDGGILKVKTLVNGKGYSEPLEGAVVEVHLVGSYEGKVFEDRELKFDLGEGCEEHVIEGVERALKKFRKGEKSVIKVKPKYAFKEEGNPELGIPPNATVEYTIELKDFEQPARSWDMSSEDRIAQAKILKEKATKYFKANKYPMAVKFYDRIIEYINPDSAFIKEADLAEERQALLLAVRLNLGLVYLKMSQCYEAKNECDLALEIDPQNVKGLFRRGQAYLGMGEPEKAKADFEAVVKIEPSNKLAANQIVVCCHKIREERAKEKKIYANMFEKFAKKDKEEEVMRYGWWDDKKREPVVTEVQPVDVESVEEAKAEKRRQLENLKKFAKAKKEKEEEERRKKEEAGMIIKEEDEEEAEEEGAGTDKKEQQGEKAPGADDKEEAAKEKETQ